MEIAKWLPHMLEASAQASAGILLLLAVRMLPGRFLSGRWLYVLWMVVMVRLLLPGSLLPEAPRHLPHAPTVNLPAGYLPRHVPDESAAPQAAAPVLPPKAEVDAGALEPRPGRPVNWRAVAACLWLAGAAGLAAYLAGTAWWLRRRILRGQRATPPEIVAVWERCLAKQDSTVPKLMTSASVKAPVLVGLRKTWLVLPAGGLEFLSAENWEHIFRHELAHARRRDCMTNLLPLAALCVHWFNPLVWLSQRAIRTDRELATDELVLRDLGEQRADDYAATLLRVLSGGDFSGVLPGAIGIAESGSDVRRRFRRIVGYRPSRMVATVFGAALLGMVGLISFAQEKAAALGAIRTAKDVQEHMLAAGRAQDSKALLEVLRLNNGILAARGEDARIVLEASLREGDTPAFVFLLDALRRAGLARGFDANKVVDWQPGEAALVETITKERKDLLAALLARGLDLKLLAGAQAKAAPRGAFAEWLNGEVKAATQSRDMVNRLVKAAQAGDIAAAQKELDAGAGINGAGDAQWTPLTEAVRSKQLAMVKFLLGRGANPNTPRVLGGEYLPISYAQSAEMAQALKDAGADIHAKDYPSGDAIFLTVARSRPTEVVKWFIDQGADPKARSSRWDSPTALFYTSKPETAKLLVERGVPVDARDERGETALFGAVRESHKSLDLVKVLLAEGADPNARNKFGNVPLMNAPNAAAVELLVAHGADVTSRNKRGQTVLQYTGYEEAADRRTALEKHGVTMDLKTEGLELLKNTVLSHDLARAKELLAVGVDPDAEGIGFPQYRDSSAMSLATGFGHMDMVDAMRAAGGKDVGLLSQAAAAGDVQKVRELLAQGASVREATSFGITPLSFALRRGKLETMRELLKAGADPNAIDNWGLTPHIFARFMDMQWKSGRDGPLQFSESGEEEKAFYPAAIALMTEYAAPDPNRKTPEGETAMTIGAACGNVLTLSVFKDMGGNLDYQRPDGMTALMLAIAAKPANADTDISRRIGKDGEVVKTSIAGSVVNSLLEMKADPSLRNKAGKTAMDLALERNDKEITSILKNFAASKAGGR